MNRNGPSRRVWAGATQISQTAAISGHLAGLALWRWSAGLAALYIPTTERKLSELLRDKQADQREKLSISTATDDYSYLHGWPSPKAFQSNYDNAQKIVGT